MKIIKCFLLYLIITFFHLKVQAAVYTWIGGNNESFYNPNNFSPNRTLPFPTDTILIKPGFGGDTIVANAYYQTNSNYFYFQIGFLKITGNRIVTINCQSINFVYTHSISIVGVNGKTLEIDSAAQLNIYSNGNQWYGTAVLRIGTNNTYSESIINGKFTINSVNGVSSNSQKTFTLEFVKNKIQLNGTFEILSDSVNLNTSAYYPNLIRFNVSISDRSKIYLNGDFIYTGGRANTDFIDTTVQINTSGRMILNYKGTGTEHNLKGVYMPGSQIIINQHPGSDTSQIVFPDSIYNLVVNTSQNINPIYFVAKSALTNVNVPIKIKGNVTINSSGGNFVEFNTAQNNQYTSIAGNLLIYGGGLQIRNYSVNALDTGSRLIINGNYIQSGGTLDFIGTHPKVGQISIKGNFYQYNGFIKNTSRSALPQLIFNGNATQNIRLRSNIDDSITFVFNNSSGFILDSNLYVGAGSVVNFISGAYSGVGNIIYINPSSSLIISNTSPANISSKIWNNSNAPYNVILNNIAPINSSESKHIYKSLYVNSGVMYLPLNDSLVVGSNIQSAKIFHSGNGRIIGKLCQWISTTPDTYVFPIGTINKATPVTVQYTNAPAQIGTLTAQYVFNLPGNNGLPLIQNRDSVFRTLDSGYWNIQAGNGINSGIYTIKAFGNAVSGVTNFQKLVLLKRNSSLTNWSIPGIHALPLGKNDSFYLSRSGLTGFSDFCISESMTKILDPDITNNYISGDKVTCYGSNSDTLFGSQPNDGSGIYTYRWIQSTISINGPYSLASGVNTSSNYYPSQLNSSTWYKRVVFSGTSRDTSNSVFIRIVNRLNIGLTVNNQYQCSNDNQFNLTDTTTGNVKRLWVFGNGDTSTLQTLYLSFNNSNTIIHPVKLYGSSDGNCTDSFTINLFTFLNPVKREIFGDTLVRNFDTAYLEVQNKIGSSFKWFLNNNLLANFSNKVSVYSNTAYVVQLKLLEVDSNNCLSDTSYKYITFIHNFISSSQSICFNSSPDTLFGSEPSISLNGFNYKWIQSTDSIGSQYVQANGNNLNRNYYPSSLSETRKFKRIIYKDAIIDTSKSVTIQVYPKLNAGFSINKQIQCFNRNSFILKDTTQGAIFRKWFLDTGDTLSNETIILHYSSEPNSQHLVKLHVFNAGNCIDSFSNTLTLNESPAIKIINGDSIVKQTDTVIYNVNHTTGSNYFWSFNKGIGNGNLNNIQIIWNIQGYDTLKMVEVNKYGCLSDTIYKLIQINPMNGLTTIDKSTELNVFPNPSHNSFEILADSKFIQEIRSIEIIDLNGFNVFNAYRHNIHSDSISVYFEGIYGLYILKIQLTNGDIFYKKIVLN